MILTLKAYMHRDEAILKNLKLYYSDSTCKICGAIDAKRYTSTGNCWHCKQRTAPMTNDDLHEQIFRDYVMRLGFDTNTDEPSHWISAPLYAVIAKRYKPISARQTAYLIGDTTYAPDIPCKRCNTRERRTDSGACVICEKLKRAQK